MCNCSECVSITVTTGAKGDDGTSTSVVTGTLSTTAAVHYMYTANRASTASNALNYDWAVLTVPAVSSANIAVFNATMQINSIGSNDITITLLQNGSVVAGTTYAQNAGTREILAIRYELSNVSQGDDIKIRLTSSDTLQTPTLKTANCQIDIWC